MENTEGLENISTSVIMLQKFISETIRLDRKFQVSVEGGGAKMSKTKPLSFVSF